MAGDWIKMRVGLRDSPKVDAICCELDNSEAETIGALFILWSIADSHSEDGNIPNMTKKMIDRKTGVSGFADALEKIGWIVVTDSGITLPDYEEHNGSTAKKRCSNAKRQAKFKSYNVTPLPPGNTSALPREEKRREEEKREDIKKTCPKTDDSEILKKLWEASPKKSRERSSKVKVAKSWKALKEKPTEEILLNAIADWAQSEKWTSGFAEGLHIWINDEQWDNLPEVTKLKTKPLFKTV